MTTRTTLDTRTALEAYMEHHIAALALIERIHSAIENHDTGGDPEALNWGHVGTMAHTQHELQEIADQLFHEGEYAPDDAA